MDTPPHPVIAYVDDNAAMRHAMGQVLRGAGFTVMEGGTGEDALRLARSGPELLILDVKLPDVSGFEVCRRIKQDTQTASLPVLHLSATCVDDDHKVAALESGADAYLMHPVEPLVLLATVRALLRARSAERLVRATAREWESTFNAMQDGLAILDLQGRIVRCNRTMAEWLGRSPEELAGTRAVSFHGAEEPAGGWPFFRALRSLARETSLVRRGDRWLRISADPILDADGRCEGVVRIVVDVTEQKRLQAERDSVHERVASVLASITEAYFAVDREWRFVEMNHVAAERIFRRSPADLLGKAIWDEFPAGIGTETERRFRRAMETLKPVHLEARSERLDSWFEVHAYPRGERLEVYTRDITGRKRAELEKEEAHRREREARREAEAANRLKDDFLATLSHELRTPLNAILGWTHLLRWGPPDAASRAAEVIERQARMQAQMISDMLDVSRIVSGNLSLDVQPIDLGAVIRSAADTVRPAAEAKGIRMDVSIDPSATGVMGDFDRLQQVAWNLLSNAIKFSPRDSVVRVRLDGDAHDVVLVVQDAGAGIAPEFLPHVFDRFRQADGSYSRRHGGVGLGLAIVRHLVEGHGGTVKAMSPGEGKGATFLVTIPRARLAHRAAAQAPRRDASSAPSPRGRGPLPRLDGTRILLVDDHPDTLGAVEVLLQAQGADVSSAASVALARQETLRHKPHVVLCDIGLPGEDGYTYLRWLREQPAEEGGGAAVVAVTAYAAASDRDRAMDAGFDAYLAKPLHPDDLVRLVARVRGGMVEREVQ
jgi:PAS domain S-box-containing protein